MKSILPPLFVLLLLVLAGCQPPSHEEAYVEEAQNADSEPKYLVIEDEEHAVSGSENKAAEVNSAQAKVQNAAAEITNNALPEALGLHDPASGNPNWKARYEEIKADRRARFQKPDLNTEMTFYMKNGNSKKGTLISYNDTSAEIEFSAGTARVERQLFGGKTRVALWADDYALYYAKKLAQKEKDDYELAAKKEAARAEAEIIKKDKEGMVTALRESRPVNNKQDGNSVQQVKDYLKKALKHPDTIQYLKWFPVKPGGLKEKEGGTMVRCKYKVQTDSFGVITERKIFFMDKYGSVYQVAGYKEE